MTPELSQKLAFLRQKCATGTATREEIAEGVRALREVRGAAVSALKTNPVAKAKGIAPVNTGALLAGLGEMVKK
jgi:hypothetical protein